MLWWVGGSSLTRVQILCPLPFWGKDVFARALLKYLPPTQLCKKCRWQLTWCNWKRRFNSAAFEKLSHRLGGWAGHVIAKVVGNVFADPDASSSAPYPQELNQWNSSIEKPLHSSTVEKSERPEQNQDLRCHSGLSAKDSVIFSGGDSSKNYGADQQRLQILDLHFDKFPTPATFVRWKIRFKTEVCTCSQFPSEAMQWIKEVELLDSVDDLRSSSSTRGISMPNFEVLDARIASELNKIIHNSQFKRRISLEEQKAQKQDRFLRDRQIAYLIYDYFRVIGIHDSVDNYADLFTISLRNDDIQEFDSKSDGILLSMTKISPDDILEGLCKLRIRESEKLKTVLELYNMEIHQKKAEPDYHRLKTMVTRSIEQDLRNRNFGVTKQRGQIILVGNGKTTSSVLKETIAVSATIRISVQKQHSRILLRALLSGRMREMHREPEVPEARVPVEECLDCRARITSKELAPIHSVKNGILQNACSTSQNGCTFGEKCSYAHRQFEEQLSKRSQKNGDDSTDASFLFNVQIGVSCS